MPINVTNISPSFELPAPFSEYAEISGGRWFYTHNKPGTKWFDDVANSKGWTVDFNLTVRKAANSDLVFDDDKIKGIGVYVNDGTRKEIISFMTQEIIFKNANRRIIFDTTSETDYRLIGKEDNIELFASVFPLEPVSSDTAEVFLFVLLVKC